MRCSAYSKDVTGPRRLGYIDPVVLLPSSFLSLEEEEQRRVLPAMNSFTSEDETGL
jgi:hypothetical protein